MVALLQALSRSATGSHAADPPPGAVATPYLSPRGAALALAAAVLLCWPMLLTSVPLVFFDTLSYFTNGEEIWTRVSRILASGAQETAAPAGAGAGGAGGAGARAPADAAAVSIRSLPYAAYFYPLAASAAGLVLVCVLQTAMTLWVFLALCPPLNAQARGFALAAFAATGTLTTLPWFASYAMPDLLGAVLPMYFALAPGRIVHMGYVKRLILMAIATFALLSHYGNLPLALILAVGTLCWCLWRRRHTAGTLTFCLAPLALAFAINLATSIVIGAVAGPPAAASAERSRAADAEGQGQAPRDVAAAPVQAPAGPARRNQAVAASGPSITPNRIPVLLARSLEDGPSRWYLDEECREGARYAMCEVFERMPETVYAFLWVDTGLRSATPDQLARIRAEETEIVIAATLRYPLQQAAALSRNLLEQAVRVGTGELIPIRQESVGEDITTLRPRTVDNEGDPVLQAFDRITPIATLLAFLVLGWRVVTGRTQACLTEAIVVIFLALVVNAAVFGGLSAPVDRYQSRMIWLVPALLALDLTLSRSAGRPGAANSSHQKDMPEPA